MKRSRTLLKLILLLTFAMAVMIGLTVTANAIGEPQVSVEPQGSGSVDAQYDGSNWTLTATPEEGNEFDFWSYDYDGSPEIETGNPWVIDDNTIGNYSEICANFKDADIEYPLWVGGVQVSEMNSAGDGWSYDAKSKTLVLDCYSYSGEGSEWKQKDEYQTPHHAAIIAAQDLTIELNGMSTVTHTSSEGDSCGIAVYGGKLTINGSGELAVAATGDDGFASSGIDASDGLIINSGKVSATGKSIGIVSGEGDVTINDGIVIAEGSDKGIQASQNVEINGGEVSATGGDTSSTGISGNISLGISVTLYGNNDYMPEGSSDTDKIASGPVSYEGSSYKYMKAVYTAMEPVSYLDAGGTEQSCRKYIVVDENTKTWGIKKKETWYVVNSDVKISGESSDRSAVSVIGDVHLILCDGAKLTVENENDGCAGIYTEDENISLDIYVQSTGSNMGELSVIAQSEGISSKDNVTINGGRITSKGGYGIYAGKGVVTINDGIVEAISDGGTGAAGIRAKGMRINGGTVTASGGSGDNTYGIMHLDELKINSGNVTALGTKNGIRSDADVEISDSAELSVRAGTDSGSAEVVSDISAWKQSGNHSDKWVHVEATVLYPLWVGGIQVTSANKHDVMGDADEGVSVSFTPAATGEKPAPARLRLNNAGITAGYNDSAVYYSGSEDLTIDLSGEKNSINVKSDGINVVNASLMIRGSGSLNIIAGGNGITANGDIEISSGALTADAGGDRGIYSRNGDVVINDGEVSAKSIDCGIAADNMTVNGGTVTATGDAACGISANIVTINDGTVTALSPGEAAIRGTVKNAIAGIGWTNAEGTQGRKAIDVNVTGQTLEDYKNLYFTPHVHSFTYEVDGSTITVICSNEDGKCTLNDGEGNHAAKLTITADDAAYTGSEYTGAAVTNKISAVTGDTQGDIEYYKVNTSDAVTGGTKLSGAPTNAGYYYAKVTLTGVSRTYSAVDAFTITPMALEITGAAATDRAYDKNSSEVAISDVTFEDSSKTAVILTANTDYSAVGEMDDANAGTGKNVTVFVTILNDNYSLAEDTAATVVNISKADALPLADVTDSLLYTAASVFKSVANVMPEDAGTLSYKAGTAARTGSVTVTDFTVGETSGAVTATLSGGAVDDTITMPVTIGSANYADSTVNVVITLTAKADAGVSVRGVPDKAVKYGDADFTLMGTIDAAGSGTGKWKWRSSNNEVLQITPYGAAATVKILKAGFASITAEYESDTTIGSAMTGSITVNKKALTVKALNKRIKAGEKVPDLRSPVPGTDYSVEGLVGEDTLTTGPKLAYATKPDNTKAGIYRITVSGAKASDNYTITYEAGTLSITGNAPAEADNPIAVAMAKSKGSKSLKFTWNKVEGAVKYEVWMNECRKKKMKEVKTLGASKTTWTKKKLKKKTAYKFYVVAKDAGGKVIARSLTGHVLTGKSNRKYTNAKSLSLDIKSAVFTPGKSFRIGAKQKKAVSGKKLLSKGHAALLRYRSSNPEVASVSKDGRVTGLASGTCTIYVQTVNGIWDTVEVTVN